jgi:hypothetical protein
MDGEEGVTASERVVVGGRSEQRQADEVADQQIGRPPPLRSLTIGGVGLIVGGAIVGPWLGYELLRGLQDTFGGHRRMTHSLITSALLAVLSIVL